MLVTKLQEKNITYSSSSALNSDLHPVRPGAQKTYDDEPVSDEEDVQENAETEEGEDK